MTPKQRVLKRWPDAVAVLFYKDDWRILFAGIEGKGPTPAAAWKNAAERLK